MREIKYRGKRADGGGWIEDSETYIHDGDGVWLSDDERNVVQVMPETVGQYTGLLDKNGRRIYEGDICRNVRGNKIVSISWHGTFAGFVWSREKENCKYLHDFGDLFKVHDNYVVIGNIWDCNLEDLQK